MASSAPARGRKLRGRTVLVVTELAVPVAAIVLWWTLSAGSNSLYFPPLSKIVTSLRQIWLFDHFTTDALPSLGNLAVGLLLAAAIGVGAGVLLGLLPVIGDALTPPVEFLRAIPGVALLPAALLLFGLGPSMKIALIAYAAVWPILLNTIDGVRSVDPVVLDVANAYRLKRIDRLFRIVLPSASPAIVAGMRTSLSIGITVIIFSEMFGSTSGIGFQILSAQRNFAVPDMWAGIILLGIIGYLLNVAFRGFEHVVLRWHRGMRQPARN